MANQTDRSWFDHDDTDGVTVAVITDDLHVEISALGIVTVHAWNGAALPLDFDDTVDVAVALTEAVMILRARGHSEVIRPARQQ